jgi:hypothetical protein
MFQVWLSTQWTHTRNMYARARTHMQIHSFYACVDAYIHDMLTSLCFRYGFRLNGHTSVICMRAHTHIHIHSFHACVYAYIVMLQVWLSTQWTHKRSLPMRGEVSITCMCVSMYVYIYIYIYL